MSDVDRVMPDALRAIVSGPEWAKSHGGAFHFCHDGWASVIVTPTGGTWEVRLCTWEVDDVQPESVMRFSEFVTALAASVEGGNE